MGSSGSCTSVVALGKRKHQQAFILQLAARGETRLSASESDVNGASLYSPSDCQSSDDTKHGPSNTKVSIANGKLLVNDFKRYHCTFAGCTKSYRKPSRLEEHERSHTGERPFVCSACGKTYFRETHLQAHARTHQDASARAFICPKEDCSKRFWTAQHLKRHEEMHGGLRPYKCLEGECTEAFVKHHQLRAHVAACHCPPGTKLFRCEKAECTKSFSTNQKLRAHLRTHEEQRYACFHQGCTLSLNGPSQYFPTWSALQEHTRSAHPPTCPHESCKGKTFTQQKGLRAHMKLHEQQEVERVLSVVADVGLGLDGDLADDEEPVRKRRRGGEVGRDWVCEEDGCGRDFKSKKARDTHFKVTHLQRRDFVCAVEGCGQSFGYKHLLQRHAARVHSLSVSDDRTDTPLPASSVSEEKPSAIDILTGKAYKDRTTPHGDCVSGGGSRQFTCPYPDISFVEPATQASVVGTGERGSERIAGKSKSCMFAFSRAYDLRRHFNAVHGLAVGKDPVDRLVARLRLHEEQSPIGSVSAAIDAEAVGE